MKNIYCLYDTVARMIAGPLILERHEAPVIRMFHDLLKDPKASPSQHPSDYNVICLGSLDDDGDGYPLIYPVTSHTVVATGASWLAAQQDS